MDIMINSELVKKLRKQASWSQDQLAAIAGISLRTVQRVEKEGACALESRKALASAFGINATDLELDSEAIDVAVHRQRGRKYGYAGAIIGLIGAYSGISLDLANGGMSLGMAGAFYGGVGAVFGASCAAIGWRSDKRSRRLE
ncbi:MAG: helix-turn-helix transcriptional regulator [Gammaproteobacteria bacterium]|nr:helix-turn-helix transcriptional regulator [Gammaproteobacteria bacterium]